MRSLLKINFIIFLVTIFSSSTLVAKTIPLEEWAKRADVRSVTLSPNGEKTCNAEDYDYRGHACT